MRTEKEIVTGFIQAACKIGGSWEEVAQYADGNGKYTHPLFQIYTIREWYNSIVMFRQVFPNLNQKIVAVAIADDGHVYVKTQASATFFGNFEGIIANGKSWEAPIFWEFELADDKIISASELVNHHAINEQLGLALFKAPFERRKAL